MNRLEMIIRELFQQEEPTTVFWRGCLHLKFVPSQRRLIVAKKGEFVAGGAHEMRNWPTASDESAITEVLVAVLGVPFQLEVSRNEKAQSDAGNWWYSIQFLITDTPPQQAMLLVADEPPTHNYVVQS